MGERETILSLLQHSTVTAAAKKLGISVRTLRRRMRSNKIKALPAGRPRRQITFSTLETHDQVLRDEGVYWRSLSVEERISAVEVIRAQTIPSYHSDTARLERVCSRFSLRKS